MKLKKGDILYYRGLGYGMTTSVHKISEKNGEKLVHANNGVVRGYLEVVKNECDLYTSKEAINKKLRSIGTGCTLIP